LIFGLALGPSSAFSQDDLAAREQAAKQAVMSFAKELSAALEAGLKTGGPSNAIGICRDVAPAISNRISLEKGWKVTRVGTRVRNAMIGIPDAWEQQVLSDFRARAAQGESYKQMSYSEIVEEPGGRYFRYMKAIPVQEVCVACHGKRADLAEPVRAALIERYPHDKAVNYQVGDLRGAFSIKQPLNGN
jgi:hypothetical protein